MFGKLNQEVIGSHTEKEWRSLVRMWNWRCFYCARPVCTNSIDPNGELTKDHQLPISRGGTDFIWNIVPACTHCNLLKGNKTVDEFRAARPGAQKRTAKEIHISKATPMVGERQTIGGIGSVEPVNLSELLKQWSDYCGKLKNPDARYPVEQTDEWYRQRRAQLRVQAANMAPSRRLERLGQLVLPIFGDNSPKKLMETESQTLVVSQGIEFA